MKVLDANDWEYIEAKKKAFIANKLHTKSVAKKNKGNAKKYKTDTIAANNNYMKGIAEKNADNMRRNPSELEKRMQKFLDNQHISYDFQKVFYLKERQGKISQFFIADFYIKTKNVIVETDGKFHETQKEYDEWRTKTIQKQYPCIKVIRWKWKDFNSYVKMKELVSRLK